MPPARALRLGAKEVTILYRRSREEMPASPEEIEEALEEGVTIEYLLAPVTISPPEWTPRDGMHPHAVGRHGCQRPETAGTDTGQRMYEGV